METLDLIDSSHINSFSISVTEEIQPRYLLTFLRTHIENQKFLLNEHSCFYYHFHRSILQYEVIVFNALEKKSIPEVFILKAYNTTKKNIVFLLESSFCLFINQELVLLKKVDTLMKEDIKEYISQVYNIIVDDFIEVSPDEIQKLSSQYQKKFYKEEKKRFFPFIELKSFLYFRYFFLIVSLVFSFLLYTIYNDQVENQKYSNTLYTNTQLQEQKKLMSQYKQFQEYAPVKKLTPLINSFNDLGIKVLKLEYLKKRILIQVVHSKKDILLQLLAKKEFQLTTKAIYFEKSLQSHILEIEFVF